MRTAILALSACTALAGLTLSAQAHEHGKSAVLETYADIAEAKYADSLIAAKRLQAAVEALTSNPSAEALEAAKAAWIASRVPYQQTEVYRFGNPIVDDWEGKVNAWPLDEGLIDYVDTAVPTAARIRREPLLRRAQRHRQCETLVLSGEYYRRQGDRQAGCWLEEALHEARRVSRPTWPLATTPWSFCCGVRISTEPWTPAAESARPWTDYATGANCAGGNCERRAAYLKAATDLLVDDLAWMTEQWGDERLGPKRHCPRIEPHRRVGGNHAHRYGFSLSYGELAGERMKLGLMLHDPEEEHDCFSDNTHNSHYYDALRASQNIYHRRYTRIDGSLVMGAVPVRPVAANDGGSTRPCAASPRQR